MDGPLVHLMCSRWSTSEFHLDGLNDSVIGRDRDRPIECGTIVSCSCDERIDGVELMGWQMPASSGIELGAPICTLKPGGAIRIVNGRQELTLLNGTPRLMETVEPKAGAMIVVTHKISNAMGAST